MPPAGEPTASSNDPQADGADQSTRVLIVEDMAWVFRLKLESDAIIEESEYVAAIARLKAAGYRAHDGDVHWQKFAKMRGKYASGLNQIAQWLAAPPAPWVGDRSYLPHRQRARRTAAAPKPAS